LHQITVGVPGSVQLVTRVWLKNRVVTKTAKVNKSACRLAKKER